MTTFEQELIHVLKQINTNLTDMSNNISETNRQLSGIKTEIEIANTEVNWGYRIQDHLDEVVKALKFIGSVQDERM